MKVTLVSKTQISKSYLQKLMKEAELGDDKFLKNIQGPEALMAYTARVSSPNQKNPGYAKLLRYCADHKHFSVFEMADVTFEIKTTRAIAQQIIRHRSFCFQEFSQRYAKVDHGVEIVEARRQDEKNRQNSVDDMNEDDRQWFKEAQERVSQCAFNKYSEALDRGIAKEQARFLLPLSTVTKLYMKGSIRSWIHYVELRSTNGTQKEHADIAIRIKEVLKKEFPVVSEALRW